MAEPLLDIRGLRFAYHQAMVLDGLDLAVEGGRFYGVLGPNGCGKSTLLDLITGTLRPGAGSLRLRGREIGSTPRIALARELALVPQEFSARFSFSVRDTVLMGRHPHLPRFTAPGAEDQAAVEEAMARMDVAHLAAKPVTRLSGGERQRAALARALAQDTPLILLDEPTSHLDVKHAWSVLGCLEDLVRRRGRTVLAVMHDLGLAAAFCDHLVLINQGRVFAAGPSREVLTSANLREVFGVTARVAWDDFAGARTVTFHKPKAVS